MDPPWPVTQRPVTQRPVNQRPVTQRPGTQRPGINPLFYLPPPFGPDPLHPFHVCLIVLFSLFSLTYVLSLSAHSYLHPLFFSTPQLLAIRWPLLGWCFLFVNCTNCIRCSHFSFLPPSLKLLSVSLSFFHAIINFDWPMCQCAQSHGWIYSTWGLAGNIQLSGEPHLDNGW